MLKAYFFHHTGHAFVKLWSKSRSSLSAEITKKIIGCLLFTPVKTRWNSLFEAFDKIISVESDLDRLCEALDLEKFEKEELNYIKEYLSLMKPIATYIDALQADNILYGHLMPYILSCAMKLKIVSNKKSLPKLHRVGLDLYSTLMNDRFSYLFDLKDPKCRFAFTASLLIPSIKLGWTKSKVFKEPLDHQAIIEICATEIMENLDFENFQTELDKNLKRKTKKNALKTPSEDELLFYGKSK